MREIKEKNYLTLVSGHYCCILGRAHKSLCNILYFIEGSHLCISTFSQYEQSTQPYKASVYK